MAKVSAKDPSRSRAKNASALEAVATSITKLQELLVQAEDLKQEGFPYRDAVRARVELHVRECAKVVFGERAPESQQWKHYHVRATTPGEVVTTIAQLHELLGQLERKKLELLGIPPPPSSQPNEQPQHAESSGKTVSEETAQGNRAAASPTAPSTPIGHDPTQPSTPPATVDPAVHAPERLPAPLVPTGSVPTVASPTQASAPQLSSSPPSPQTSVRRETPIAPEPREQVRDAIIQAEAQTAAPRPLTDPQSPSPDQRPPAPVGTLLRETLNLSPAEHSSADPLDTVRKICGRFHAVVRQLRLRREYRPTIDVEDERDVQDLMFTLLRYELEEVSPYEWVPPYQQPTPSVAMVLPRHQLVILAKKTRSGHGAREIAQELTVDGQEFSPANGHHSIACFVYDPDGRIGNPRSLEAELTKVSDAQVLEVIIYPK